MGRWAMYRRRGTAGGNVETAEITGVFEDVPGAVIWEFDTVLATIGASWNEFTVDGAAPLGAVDGGNPGDNFVTLAYAGSTSGVPWAVNNQQAGLTFAGGKVLVIPQSGGLP